MSAAKKKSPAQRSAESDGMELTRHPATGDWRLRCQRPDLKPVYEVLIEERHVAWLVNALAPYAGGPVAAAPEMLEALEMAFGHFDDQIHCRKPRIHPLEYAAKLRAAIRKARGES